MKGLWGLGGLPFWSEAEILARDHARERLELTIRSALTAVNQAWTIRRCEGPLLIPRSLISSSYDGSDIFELVADLGDGPGALRPETTASSYQYARYLRDNGVAKLPLCVWQAGKSFRRETNDGASASKLRFQEFYQQEFQCLYHKDSKADYRAAVMERLVVEIARLCMRNVRVIDSERVPAYSTRTHDIEVDLGDGKWREIASISTRTDYPDETVEVLEIAVGLDRIVFFAMLPPQRTIGVAHGHVRK